MHDFPISFPPFSLFQSFKRAKSLLILPSPSPSPLSFRQDWYYGHDLSSSSSEGLVPKSYVAVRRGKDKSSSPRRRRDVLDELSESLLPVWLPRWKRLFTRSSSKAGGGREGEEEGGFDRLQALMEEAVDIKRQVGVGVLTNEQTCELKRRLGRCLESGGAMLGLEAAPRDAADGARVEDCDDDDDDNDDDGDDDVASSSSS